MSVPAGEPVCGFFDYDADFSIPMSCAISHLDRCYSLRVQLERSMSERQALFISHASPEDNASTIWLGAKLAAAGYEVWAEVLRLTGGDDWQRKSEDALRNRACKVLLVANQKSVDKQGVRNEIRIASDVAKKIGDKRFIIRLKHSAQAGTVVRRPFLSPAVCALRAKHYRACPIYRLQ
jgi:hypothetical protein